MQNSAIHQRGQQLNSLEQELTDAKGIFKDAVNDWQKKYGIKAEPDSIRERLKYHRQHAKKQENSRQRTSYLSDRGAR